MPWVGAAVAFIFITYGGLVFGNPLLKRASAIPGGLLSTPIADLPKARRLLKLAGRLNSVLSSANVPRQKLSEAVAFATNAQADFRVPLIVERLELAPRGNAQRTPKGICYLDATTPERLLLNLPRVRLAFPPVSMSAHEILAEIRRIPNLPDVMTLVVPADAAQANALRAITQERVEPIATLSSSEITSVLLSTEPLMVFARSLADQVPPTRLSAYQRGGRHACSDLLWKRAGVIQYP